MTGKRYRIEDMFTEGRGPVVQLVPFGVGLSTAPKRHTRFAVVVDGHKAGEIVHHMGSWVAYSPTAECGLPSVLANIRQRSIARDLVAAQSGFLHSWACRPNRRGRMPYTLTVCDGRPTLLFLSAKARRRATTTLRDLGMIA